MKKRMFDFNKDVLLNQQCEIAFGAFVMEELDLNTRLLFLI